MAKAKQWRVKKDYLRGDPHPHALIDGDGYTAGSIAHLDDAKQIAAAMNLHGDMLAALKAVVDPGRVTQADQDESYRMAFAAIRKAESR